MRKRWLVILVSILCLGIILFLLISDHPFIYESEVVSTVHSIERAEPNLTLAIYTDIHHDPAKDEPHVLKETMDCVAEMMKRVRIDALWNLGDLINGHTTTKEEAIGQINEVLAEENKITANAHRITGNHDNNIQATYESNAGYGMEEVLTAAELNAVLANTTTSQIEHHSSLHPTDYYVDFKGIRVVCIAADETTWTKETAVSQRAKTDKTARHQHKSFTHKEKPDRMITRSGRGTDQTNCRQHRNFRHFQHSNFPDWKRHGFPAF